LGYGVGHLSHFITKNINELALDNSMDFSLPIFYVDGSQDYKQRRQKMKKLFGLILILSMFSCTQEVYRWTCVDTVITRGVYPADTVVSILKPVQLTEDMEKLYERYGTDNSGVMVGKDTMFIQRSRVCYKNEIKK
jgi:hypothetical protein